MNELDKQIQKCEECNQSMQLCSEHAAAQFRLLELKYLNNTRRKNLKDGFFKTSELTFNIGI